MFLQERGNWWLDELDRSLPEEKTLESVSSVLEELGAAGSLKEDADGNYFYATLEKVEDERLPCGFSEIKIAIFLDRSGGISEYALSYGSICFASSD